MIIKKNNASLCALCGVAFLSFLNVTFLWQAPLFFLLFGCLVLFLFKMRASINALNFIGLFILPFLIGFFSLFFFYVFPDYRFVGSEIQWGGRAINIIICLSFFLLAAKVFVNKDDELLAYKNFQYFVNFYLAGCVVLMASAMWHALSIYTNLVAFPFETRSQIHSASGLVVSASERVTGLAREPSYLVPFLVDAVAFSILAYGFKAKAYIISFCAIMMIVFSLSPSGYIIFSLTILATCFFWLLKFRLKFSKSFLISLIFIPVVLVLILNYGINSSFFEYISQRVVDYNPESSSRAYMNIKPVGWLFESSISNMFFGFGLKSFSVIGDYYSLPSGLPIHATSNNYFVDILWESGFVGLASALAFFAYILFLGFRRCSKHDFLIFLYLYFDLLFSSLVRADFVTARFFIVLAALYFLAYGYKRWACFNCYPRLSY